MISIDPDTHACKQAMKRKDVPWRAAVFSEKGGIFAQIATDRRSVEWKCDKSSGGLQVADRGEVI